MLASSRSRSFRELHFSPRRWPSVARVGMTTREAAVSTIHDRGLGPCLEEQVADALNNQVDDQCEEGDGDERSSGYLMLR
jgi:hypothetical protein